MRPSVRRLAALGWLAACTPSPPAEPEEAPLCRAPAPLSFYPLGHPEDCDNYQPQQPGEPVTLAFVNRSDDDVLLLGGCRGGYVRVLGDASGNIATGPPSCATELPPCEWWLDPDNSGCLLTCSIPPAIRIAPGMRYETTWRPLVMFEADMPAECAADPQLSGACMMTRRPPPGDYLLIARYAPVGTCVDCDCEPGPEGWCELSPTTDALATETRDVAAQYDGVCAEVELSLE